MKPGAGTAPAGALPPELSAKNKLRRSGYYLLFWYAPYRQFTCSGRRFFRRLHVVVFAAGTVTYGVDHDVLGAVMMALGAIVSQSSLKLVDRDLEGGERVPRTRWNLPADLEVKRDRTVF